MLALREELEAVKQQTESPGRLAGRLTGRLSKMASCLGACLRQRTVTADCRPADLPSRHRIDVQTR